MLDRPGKIICIGLNYADHAQEAGLPLPQEPLTFAKWSTSLIGQGDEIRIPSLSKEIDYEAELAVVIGRRAFDVSSRDALGYVRGYTCFNDITARDVQLRDGQWTRAKSFDTFGPIGPRIVPAAEIPDPQALSIQCTVNGEVVQDSNTSQMVFSVADIIAHISKDTTLEPGDVIATGTPAGIGMARTPARYLQSGDVVTVEIEGIGSLENPVA